MIEVREVTVKDAKNLLEFSNQVGSETNNLSYGSEGMGPSVAEEEKILVKFQNAKTSYFLLTEGNGQIVGTCNCRSFRKKRLSHRAEIGIAVKKTIGIEHIKNDKYHDEYCYCPAHGFHSAIRRYFFHDDLVHGK